MTLTPNSIQNNAAPLTAQQHHVQAAELLEQAAKCHKDAARLLMAGDSTGAQVHAEQAKAHAAKAGEHGVQAASKSASTAKVPA
ncbi:MAG: hypothetical protein O9318_07590 [Hylemonella sp.]|uniref:hypothetical protein n=1 Tax=Hylemonella sp. TaxID=2066020 RepID=UPI0022BE6FB6|nr:hypothetical protein [Hylemonella sp.]MCZ8252317.1 hypothetical protein [Hylemonella sp.]